GGFQVSLRPASSLEPKTRPTILKSASLPSCLPSNLGEIVAQFSNSEAKARAAVLARRSGGSLGKLLEQLAHLLRGHADAGVGHCDRDPAEAILLPLVSGDG